MTTWRGYDTLPRMKYTNPNNTSTHKQCAQCKQVLPRASFPRNASKSDGLYAWCKSCAYARNSKYKRKRVDPKRGKRQVERRRALKHHYVNLKGGKCVHCGYNEYEAALDFHHVGKKTEHISTMINYAANRKSYDEGKILRELEECVVLCSNCHRGLHAGEWNLDEQQA